MAARWTASHHSVLNVLFGVFMPKRAVGDPIYCLACSVGSRTNAISLEGTLQLHCDGVDHVVEKPQPIGTKPFTAMLQASSDDGNSK